MRKYSLTSIVAVVLVALVAVVPAQLQSAHADTAGTLGTWCGSVPPVKGRFKCGPSSSTSAFFSPQGSYSRAELNSQPSGKRHVYINLIRRDNSGLYKSASSDETGVRIYATLAKGPAQAVCGANPSPTYIDCGVS